MALKPNSLRLLEDEFVCRCSYFADDAAYVNYDAKNHGTTKHEARVLEDERLARRQDIRQDKRRAKA